MRSTGKRVLSVLLTVAMIATLLVVPAAAAGTHTLTADDESFDSYFTITLGSDPQKKANSKTTWGEAYTPTETDGRYNYIEFGGNAKFDDNGNPFKASSNANRCVLFTTDGPATVKVWVRNTKKVKMATATDNTGNGLGTGTAITGTSSGNVYTFNITAAGSYGILPDGSTGIAKIEVTEIDPNALSVKLDQATASVTVDGTVTLQATVTPTGTAVAWTSDAENIATVDSNGMVTGVAAGTAKITATVTKGSETKTATCTVTVLRALDGIFHVFDENTTLAVVPDGMDKIVATTGTTKTDYVEAGPSVSMEAKAGEYKGTKINNSIKLNSASSQNRWIKFTAPNAGTLTLYMNNNSSFKYKVNGASQVTLGDSTTITVTTEAGKTYEIARSSGTAYCSHLLWTKTGFTCDHSCGYGEAVVTKEATYEAAGEKTKYCKNPACMHGETETIPQLVAVTSVEFEHKDGHTIYVDGNDVTGGKESLDVKYPRSWKMSPIVKPDNATDRSLTWTNANTSDPCFSVDENGVVTAIKVGTEPVTATSKTQTGVFETCQIQVLPRISKVELQKEGADAGTAASMSVGDTLTLTAAVTASAGATDAQKAVAWSVSSGDAVTVANGVITAVKTGTATVTATRAKANDYEDDVSDSIEITVGKATVNGLKITNRNPDGWGSEGGTVRLDVTQADGTTALPAGELDNVTVTCDNSITVTRKTDGDGHTTHWEATLPANEDASGAKEYTFTAAYAPSNNYTLSGDNNVTCKVSVASPNAPETTLTAQYANGFVSRSYTLGDTMTITVNALVNSATPAEGAVTYQWYKGEQAIQGQTGKTYEVASVSLDDAGTYHCHVALADNSKSVDTADVTITVNAPALTGITGALTSASAANTNVNFNDGTKLLTITGQETVVFTITTTPSVHNDTITAEVETVTGQHLVEATYNAAAGTLTIKPLRASDPNQGPTPRKVTLMGETSGQKWEITVLVNKTAAPRTMTADEVEVTAPTTEGGKGKLTIQAPKQGETYRYRPADESVEWADFPTSGEMSASVAPGKYLVRVKTADTTFQEIAQSVEVTVPEYTVPEYTVTLNLTGAAATVNGDDYETPMKFAEGTAITVVSTTQGDYDNLPGTVTVKMGEATLTAGTDYTWDMDFGTLTIATGKLTGNLTITITAIKEGEEPGPDVCCSASKPHKAQTNTTRAKENAINVTGGKLEHWVTYVPVDANGKYDFESSDHRIMVTGYGTESGSSGSNKNWNYTDIVSGVSNEGATYQLFKLAKIGDGTLTFDNGSDAAVTITLHVVDAPVATVTTTLTGLTATPEVETVEKGSKLEITLVPAAGKLLPETVTVTMGGVAVANAYDKDTGKVTIANVTGNVVITATAADKPVDTSVTAVTLKNGTADAGDAISMETGATLTLTAEVTAAAEATNKTVVWSSDKADVVKVENGVLTALKAGTAVITATSDANVNAKDSVTITVADKAVVIAEGLGCALDKGGEKTLTAKVMVGNDEKPTETAAITWSSSATAVATVTDGKVTAVAPGVALITATSGTLSDTFVVVVYDSTDDTDAKQKPGTFELAPAAGTGDIANGTRLGSDYFTVVGAGAKYQDKSGNVITLGQMGSNGVQFTVPAEHKATLNATVKSTGSSNHSAVGLLNVDTGKLVAADGKGAVTEIAGQDATTLTWTSLPAGTYQLLAPEVETTATTDAANPNKRGYCIGKLTVVQAAVSAEDLIATAVKVTDAAGKTAATLKPGASVSVSAAVVPATADQSVTWAAAAGLTKVENADGTVTVTVAAGTEPGTYKVTATSANGAEGADVVGEFVITVPVSVTGVTVTGDAEVKVRESITLTATVAPANATEKGVTWSSSDAAIATVDQTGKVTGKAEGKVTITATSKENAEIKGELEVTVKPADVAPGSTVYNFDPTKLAAAEALTPDTFAPAGDNGYFTMTGTVTGKGTPVSNVELAKNAGGSINFTVSAGKVADVTIVVSSTSNAEEVKQSHVALQKAGAAVANNEGLSIVGGSPTEPTTLTYTGLAEGSYSLVSPTVSGDTFKRGVRVIGIIVTERAEGSEPTPPTDKTYKITVDTAIVNGAVTVSKTEAKMGETITVTATPAARYELDKITVDGAAITGNTFQMPGKDVTVSATFKAVVLAEGEYHVDCDTQIVGGAVSTDKAKAKAGETVTVTATPSQGYELVAITVDGVAITGNTFQMPSKDVTVSATFKKTGGDEPTPPTPSTVDKAAFDKALAAAKAIDMDAVKASENGKDVPTTETWVTQAVKDALAKAIADAEAVEADATQADIDALTQALTEAVANWQPAAGTKSTASHRPAGSLGGSTGGTASTNTVTNPAGGKTTVKKAANGDVTITATNAEGQVIAEVKLPATVPAVGYKFVDVPAGHWAEKAINDMAGLELVKGVNETQHLFDMVSPITRGSVATILSRLANGKGDVKDIFSDVAEGQWYAEGVAWAAEAGVVTGFENGTFQPESSITREQLAVMLCRYAKLLGLDTAAANNELAIFSDADDIQPWALEGMAWCVKAGIINGRGDGTVDPDATATRAEATAMLARLVDLLK